MMLLMEHLFICLSANVEQRLSIEDDATQSNASSFSGDDARIRVYSAFRQIFWRVATSMLVANNNEIYHGGA